MPRTTLKLPNKKPAAAVGDTRAATRKPIRGSSQTAKHTSARRADSQSPVPAAPSGKPGQRNTSPARFRNELPREAASPVEQFTAAFPTRQESTVPAPEPRGTTTDSQAASPARPSQQAKKTYPQRGIARSTGARAFPPAPQRASRDAPALGERVSPAVAAEAQVQRPAEAPAATPAVTSSTPRGLAKESPRLAKLVSEIAACSRREADEWIENGWVSVDGEVITRLGARVNPKAKIRIQDAAKKHPSESVTILFNKPCHPDAAEGDHAVALIRPDRHWAEDSTTFRFQATHLRGLALAGKLDADEGGMLVFTQEGSVARRLTGGDARLEKEYHVRVEGELSADGLERLRHGLSLDKVKLLRAQVSWLSEQQLRFVLHENRKRQIQGMCEQVGLRVTEIKRVRIGSVSLGKLAAGQWRYLRADERF
ncbi:MAG: Ribosomal large subunit pseudouridine synthase F [Candidatus Accumulibacter phosphatis]|uniref:Dual-specificity RNA pseudouridine synthase RluF n=1 Tax=Candidatus Accumulibacter phosphatis TaxID=327160 RepID=A0A080M5M9_9PROT|nr:S4 domain-containing protein [Accumulibacter sp.]KFB72374.1 MAG: Ribosomal large subunit pseudouridine synthase F [Candidatus Accumulibacter phosphatis]MBL8408754.1 pseudouridine synthase [Accumulibacter sp.]HRF12768.1 S4 domain-containing protein [Candidatus Accumulibacter phosphatis]